MNRTATVPSVSAFCTNSEIFTYRAERERRFYSAQLSPAYELQLLIICPIVCKSQPAIRRLIVSNFSRAYGLLFCSRAEDCELMTFRAEREWHSREN